MSKFDANTRAGRTVIRAALTVTWVAAALACDTTSAPKRAAADAAVADDAAREPSNRPGFCEADDEDSVRDVFCADAPPEARSLSDLQKLLKLDPASKDPDAPYVGAPIADNPHSAQRPMAVLSHSTALSGHLVSPINPRVIILGTHTIMAFTRGTQRVELIAYSRKHPLALNFYVVSFEQACNQREGGCSSGELFSDRLESSWTSVSIHDGEELKNTPLDCRACHQRARETPQLLMRELEGPWTHFFLPADLSKGLAGVTGSELMADFVAAKGDEIYAGYDLTTIPPTSPFLMQLRVGTKQPLFFDSLKIYNERYTRTEDGFDPNVKPSETWEAGYEAFKRGEQLALPYVDQRATDLDKQKELAGVYRRYHAGELDVDEVPDLSDIYPDDPKERARMGVQTEPDASAEDVLIQACGSCHNDVLDQEISRARFNIDVSRLDRDELDVALDRIQRDRNDPGVMPPPESRQLDESGKKRLIEFLTRDQHESDERLRYAAEVGMAGGEVTREVLR